MEIIIIYFKNGKSKKFEAVWHSGLGLEDSCVHIQTKEVDYYFPTEAIKEIQVR